MTFRGVEWGLLGSQLNILATQLPHQLADGSRLVGDRAVAARRTLFFSDGDRDRRAMD